MAIQTYGELKTAIQNWLKRSEVVDRIPEFVELAENRINNQIDGPDIETVATLTIDAERVALPAGFIEQRSHYIDVADPIQRIQYKAPEAFWDYSLFANASGFPSFYTVEGRELVFSPVPDSSYTGKWLCLLRLDRLVNDADTNILLQDHTGLYLYGALIEGSAFLGNDPRALTWATFYDNALDQFREVSRRGRFPKGQKTSYSRVPVYSGGRTKM